MKVNTNYTIELSLEEVKKLDTLLKGITDMATDDYQDVFTETDRSFVLELYGTLPPNLT